MKTQNDKTIFNYVWLNDRPFPEPCAPDNYLCGIPLHCIDKALENAKRYPGTDFNIWVDYDFLGDSSQFFLTSHFYLFASPNVRLRSLHDIPAYERAPMFRPDTCNDVYARADLVRLYVLSHCFEETDCDVALYADFDLDDAAITHKKVRRDLGKYGFVFGKTVEDEVENGYIGVRRGTGRQFLTEKLIPETLYDANGNNNGYRGFYTSLRSAFPNLFDQGGAVTLQPRGYKIPKAPHYEELKICK